MAVTEDAVAAAATASPLRRAAALSEHADLDELHFREEVESYPAPLIDVPRFIDRKELPRKLDDALRRAGLEPRGTVVDLGAGTCWLGAWLARRPDVDRVLAVEFSARRLEQLAPVAIAHLDAPANKIERHVADFYAHGLGDAIADWIFMDAAFHHAPDPVALARVAFDLLRPGGRFVLTREPTTTLFRRTRDHGEEDDHGTFEREYRASEYLAYMRQAGFSAKRVAASGGWTSARARAILRPPLSWLNGIAFAEFTYVGTKPA